MKNILITGANGFFGKFSTKYFKDKEYNVFGLVRNKDQYKISTIQVDLSQNSHDIELPKEIDFCIHAAAISPNNTSNFKDYFLNNSLATLNLLNCLKQTLCKKIIYLSAVSIYGQPLSQKITEDTPTHNPSSYGLSKLIGENILFHQIDIPVVSIRLPGIQGPSSDRPWLSRLIKKIIRNEHLKLYNPHGLFNNAVWIDDVLNFIDLLLKDNKMKNEVFLLGSKNSMKIFKIFELIVDKTNSISKVDYVSGSKSFTLNSDKAIKKGFKSKDLRDIIKLQILNFMEN